jgi:hypothetical protein
LEIKLLRHSLKYTFLFLCLLILATLACGGSFSTANISDAYMSKDDAGDQQTTVFAQTDTPFYSQVFLANAPDDTTVRVVWTAVSVENEDPNLELGDTSLDSGDGRLVFNLDNDSPWPIGDYKVDIYLNDTLDRTLNFTVQ